MHGPDDPAWQRALRAAATAELSWCEDNTPRCAAVVPLLDGGVPVLAAPWSQATWARSLATRARVVLTLSDPRGCGPGWEPVSVTAAPRLEEDRTGERFEARLLDQELRKHPPARALADSPLLRRENWWYVPRLLVRLDVVAVSGFVTRHQPDDALLVLAGGASGELPRVRAVSVTDWTGPLRLVAAGGEAGGDLPSRETALLFGHDFTVPDLERWVSWSATGPLTGGLLDAADPGTRRAAGMPSLRERLRRHRSLRRGCLDGLRRPSS